MNKLDLASEDEVEITCHGEAISPSTTLQGLLELWLKSSPVEQVQASLGAQAKEFVMELGYRRPQRPPSS
jgi:E3 ubiquitin-protein ligase DRIP